MEHAGEVQKEDMIQNDPALKNALEEIGLRLESEAMEPRKQAMHIPVKIVMAWEQVVCDEEQLRYTRAYAWNWWKSGEAWGSLTPQEWEWSQLDWMERAGLLTSIAPRLLARANGWTWWKCLCASMLTWRSENGCGLAGSFGSSWGLKPRWKGGTSCYRCQVLTCSMWSGGWLATHPPALCPRHWLGDWLVEKEQVRRCSWNLVCMQPGLSTRSVRRFAHGPEPLASTRRLARDWGDGPRRWTNPVTGHEAENSVGSGKGGTVRQEEPWPSRPIRWGAGAQEVGSADGKHGVQQGWDW